MYDNYLKISRDYDCLAFRQIDEDISKYEPNDSYLRDCKTRYERDSILRAEKSNLRNVLRALILWSKQTVEEERSSHVSEEKSQSSALLNKKSYVVSYGTGFLQMIQRLNTITQSEKDCFSIVTGIIRCNPRPFTVE